MTDFEDNILPRYVAASKEISTTMTFTTHQQVLVQFPDRDDPIVLSCASDEVKRILQERGGEIIGTEMPQAAKARLEQSAKAALEHFKTDVERPRFWRGTS